MFFEDFSKIALGEVEPRFNAEISKATQLQYLETRINSSWMATEAAEFGVL
jgi:hypothetical protein